MKEKRQPWLKWYPSDWRDPLLRMCSLAARGLWVDLIGYMHEGEPYGHLTIAGIPPSMEEIASLIGRPVAETRKAMLELERYRVFSTTDCPSGVVIFSRRLVRDKAKADRDRANGKGGGNPELRSEVKRGVNPPVKAQKPEARDQIDPIGSAQAREPGGLTEGSKALADAFWRGLGFASKLEITPEFSGVDWRAIGWESAGWSCEMVETQARLTGRDKPLTYHEKVFATAHARLNAPLPKVEIREAETVRVSHAPNRSNGSVAAALREIREQMQSGDSDEAGGSSVLRLSSG